MPDPVPAIGQVEDKMAEIIGAKSELSAWAVRTDGSEDIAIDLEDAGKTINIYTTAYAVDQSDEQHSSIHIATIEVEAVAGTQATGTISRAVHTALAWVMQAVAADRTLGGLIDDIQEVDVAPSGANGRDAGSASLQFRVEFTTSRSDWFTIL